MDIFRAGNPHRKGRCSYAESDCQYFRFFPWYNITTLISVRQEVLQVIFTCFIQKIMESAVFYRPLKKAIRHIPQFDGPVFVHMRCCNTSCSSIVPIFLFIRIFLLDLVKKYSYTRGSKTLI